MNFKKEQLVDLSFPILTGKENFKYESQVFDCAEVDPHGSFHRPDIWYVESEVTFSSHVGTHVEVPFHHEEFGADCLTYPLENLVGEAVVLNCTGKKAGEAITLEELKKYEDKIHKGDFVFLYTGFDRKYRTPDWEPYPNLTVEACEWLMSFDLKGIGTDASTIEVQVTDCQPCHTAVFSKNGCIIESLTNLDAIDGLRVTVFILALKLERVDACPVRVLAIKDLKDC